jgi:hypothetical protein
MQAVGRWGSRGLEEVGVKNIFHTMVLGQGMGIGGSEDPWWTKDLQQMMDSEQMMDRPEQRTGIG